MAAAQRVLCQSNRQAVNGSVDRLWPPSLRLWARPVLPDFIGIKRQIASDRTSDLRSAEREDSLLSIFGRVVQHEGDRFTIVQEDQTVRSNEYRKVEVEGTLKVADLLANGTEAIRDMLATMRDGLLKEEAKVFQSVMKEVTDETGNVVKGGGRPFSAELFIEAIDKMELTFADDGTWEMPTTVCHPSQADRFRAEMDRLDSTPGLHTKATEIVNRKRDAWRAREANRKLVD